MNAIVVFTLIAAAFTLMAWAADTWPPRWVRRIVANRMDAYWERLNDAWAAYAEDVRDGLCDRDDPDAIRSAERKDRFHEFDRRLVRWGILRPTHCESCWLIRDESQMTYKGNDWWICRKCNTRKVRTNTRSNPTNA